MARNAHAGSGGDVLRILQEALHNVAKHARATRADVVLTVTDGQVVLIVEDDGIGFDPGEASKSNNGLGLTGMRERAALVHAASQVESAPGKGTSLFLRCAIAVIAGRRSIRRFAMIRILLADDHETVRTGLRLLVDAQPDMQVIAEAANGEQALARIDDSAPDVAVLDLTMPGLGGLAVARRLTNTPNATSIVVLTRHDDEAYVRELLAAGVAGYVLKQSSSDELLRAIRAAARGERYVDPVCRERLEREQAETEHPTLTPREREVLRLMAVGHSNKEIGSLLAISVKTVEVHKANAMRKLRLGGRTDVVRYAVLHEWMKDP